MARRRGSFPFASLEGHDDTQALSRELGVPLGATLLAAPLVRISVPREA